MLDGLAELGGFIFGQILDTGVRIDASLFQDIVAEFAADPVNVGQADLHTLFAGKVNTGNTSHFIYLLCSFSPVSAYAWDSRR